MNREGTRDMRQDVDTSSSGHTSPEVQVSYVNPVMVVKAKSACVNAKGAGWARFNHDRFD